VLGANVELFKKQGLAMNKFAKRTCRSLVVTNPKNILCYVLRKYADSFPADHFTCLSRLDHNRAVNQVAKKLGCSPGVVKNVVIWGNHSSTMFPDVHIGTVEGQKITSAIKEEDWLGRDFVENVSQRGALYLKGLKSSCVISLAKAAGDHLRDWWQGAEEGVFTSMGAVSDGSYNIPKGVVCSRPVRCLGKFEIEFVTDLKLNSVQELGIQQSVIDLKKEIDLVHNYFEYDEQNQESETDEQAELEKE
jgi:malate dehydrogenase